jgi:hypothetical protein
MFVNVLKAPAILSHKIFFGAICEKYTDSFRLSAYIGKHSCGLKLPNDKI